MDTETLGGRRVKATRKGRSPMHVTRYFLGIALLSALLWHGTAFATMVGNPTPRFLEGDVGIGARGSDYRETLFLDYGATDDLTLELLAGRVNFPGSSGTEFGAGVRYKFVPKFMIGDLEAGFGGFGFLRTGSEDADIGDNDFILLDSGVGLSLVPAESLSLFASVLFRYMDLDFQTPRPDENYETGTDVGFVVGAEIWVTDGFVAGLEIHDGLKDDRLAAFIEFKL